MGGLAIQYAKIPETKRNSSLRIQRKKSSQPMKTPADRILFLQRTIGNQAVQRLIKSGTLQARLRIGQPGDIYEEEADRVADAVMRMPEPQVRRQPEEEETQELIQTKSFAQQITPFVQEQAEQEEEIFQTKQMRSQMLGITPNLEAYINAIRRGDQLLTVNISAFFEHRVGTPSEGQGGIVEPAERMRRRLRRIAREAIQVDMGQSITRGREDSYNINEPVLASVPNHFIPHDGGRYGGRTYCSITGAELHNLQIVNVPGRFVINNIPWGVRCRVLLPRWVNFSQANEQDRQEWARFMRCLRIHEQGHVDLAHDFISTLASSERQVSGSNQTQLQQRLVTLGQGLRQDLQNMHDDYDDETNHGESQGAVLRSPGALPVEGGGVEPAPSMRSRLERP